MLPKVQEFTINPETRLTEEVDNPSRTYRIDYESGRVAGYCDGLEAMKQAVHKILYTDRFEHLIYSWNYGIEMGAIVGKSVDIAESELKRVVSEALLEDERIIGVDNFQFYRPDSRTLVMTFEAETAYGKIESEVIHSV